MRNLAIAITTLALTLPGSASGQNNTTAPDSARIRRPLTRGNYVRVALGGDRGVLTGHIVRISENQLIVAPDDSGSAPLTIALGPLTRLDVQRGDKLRAISAQIGAGLGTLGAGAYFFLRWCRMDEPSCVREQRRASDYAEHGQAYIGTGAVFAMGGMLAGGLIGYFLAPAPHWEIVMSPVMEHDAQGNAHTLMRVGIARQWCLSICR